MKQLYLSLLITLFSFYSYSQCTLEMEGYIHICTDSLQNGEIYLDDYYDVQGGIAPYEYTWSANHQWSLIDISASDILSDTTSANPNIISSIEDTIVLHLEITDANGQTCSDSTVITFCSFSETLGPHYVFMNQGDTTILQPAVGGNCGIIQYQWTPNYNLSNPSLPNPLAYPDTTTHYDLTVIDENGCEYQAYGFTVYVNHSFPKIVEEDKRWNVVALTWGSVSANIEYKIDGDSVKNGIAYKVIKSKTTYNNTWEVSHLLRETDDGKVYQYEFEENLLFDFSLTVGDSFAIEEGHLIVVEEDSIVLVNGDKRRMLKLECSNLVDDDYWVEGIGALSHGIHDEVGFTYPCVTDIQSRLVCHWEGEEQVYMHPFYDSCVLEVPIIEIEDISYEINIIPNPSNGIFSLQFSEEIQDVVLEIYDVSGRKLYNSIIHSIDNSYDISHLNNGMYILVLNNETGIIYRDKIVVSQ